MQDRLEFGKRMVALADVLGAQMSEAKLCLYEEVLNRFNDEQLFAAISRAASTLRFFPKPVELIELIEGKKEDQAALAWEVLLDTMQHVGAYKSILFEDGRIARVVRSMGGWEKVCHSETKQLQFQRNEFIKTFRELPNDSPAEVLDGIGDLMLATSGYGDRIKPPVRIECPSLQCGASIIQRKALPGSNAGTKSIGDLARGIAESDLIVLEGGMDS